MLTHKVLCRLIPLSNWFVTIDLSDAYFHIGRKFLRFAYQGRAYKCQAIPFRLSLAPWVFSKCLEAVSIKRHPNILVHRRRSDMLPLVGTGSQRFCYSDKPSQGSWVQYKLGEELSRNRPMNTIFGSQHKLPVLSYHAIGGEISISHTMSLPLPAGESHIVQIMPAPAWPHGFSDICGTLGASNYEGFSALGCSVAPVSTPSPLLQGENNTSVRGGSPPVEGLNSCHVRCPAGDHVMTTEKPLSG